jgi:hypothetical protein
MSKSDRDYVIIDPVTADVLSRPMTYEKAKAIVDKAAEIATANAGYEEFPITFVHKGWELRQVQEVARRAMCGNPPRTRIIYDA